MKTHWWREAKCEGVDEKVFFPGEGHTGGEYGLARYSEARWYCDRCPVIEECLDSALVEEGDTGKVMRFGFRGGMTPSQRWYENNLRKHGKDQLREVYGTRTS